MAEQPVEYFDGPAALPEKLTVEDTGSIIKWIVLLLGSAMILVLVGIIVLAWFDKVIPEALVVTPGLLIAFLGGALTGKEIAAGGN